MTFSYCLKMLQVETTTGCLRFHDNCSNMQPDIVTDIVGNSSFILVAAKTIGFCQELIDKLLHYRIC